MTPTDDERREALVAIAERLEAWDGARQERIPDTEAGRALVESAARDAQTALMMRGTIRPELPPVQVHWAKDAGGRGMVKAIAFPRESNPHQTREAAWVSFERENQLFGDGFMDVVERVAGGYGVAPGESHAAARERINADLDSKFSTDAIALDVIRVTHPELVERAINAAELRYGTCTCGKGPWGSNGRCASCAGIDLGMPLPGPVGPLGRRR